MSESVNFSRPIGQDRNDVEMDNLGQQQRANEFQAGVDRQGAGEAWPLPAAGEEPRHVAEAAIDVSAGEHRQIASVTGDSTIHNDGKLTIGSIGREGSLSLPDNTGRVRIGTNNGTLTTTNNTGDLTVKANNNEMSILENKGIIKVQKNDSDGHIAVGDENHAGISQGGWPTQRHSGRVTVGANNGTLEQHYAARSLGSVLHGGGPTKLDKQDSVRLHPSGPGGKLQAPATKAAAVAGLGVAGVATTYAVGGANAIGLYNGANGLANPTHPLATVTTAPSATGTTAHPVGLSSPEAAHPAEVPHVAAPKIGKF